MNITGIFEKFVISSKNFFFSNTQTGSREEDTTVKYVRHTYRFIDGLRKSNLGNSNYEWLNLGYWKNAQTINDACVALIELVINYAQLKNGEEVLDVGFGYGLQDIFIAKKFDKINIKGVNIVKEQVVHAQSMVHQNQLSGRVELMEGDAVKTNFKPDCFDKVFAIECALHFNRREDFFNEAYRVLKKGGVLCLADCLPHPEGVFDDDFIQTCKISGIPTDNLYTIEHYTTLLKNIGFTDIQYQDISRWVMPYALAFYRNIDERGSKKKFISTNLEFDLAAWRNEIYPKTSIYYYYIIKATK